MKQPSEYFSHVGIVAYAVFNPSGLAIDGHAGATDLEILRAADRLARMSNDGRAFVITGKCTYRACFRRGVGTIAVCHEVGHPIAKSAGRMVARALAALGSARPDADDEPTQVYHPGAAVLMTPANQGVTP